MLRHFRGTSTVGAVSDSSIEQLRARVPTSVHGQLERSAGLGFLGSMPLSDQVDHALGFVATIEESLGRHPRSVLDLGTGGGLPGLVLASCWPQCQVVLIDANERRTSFLATETEGADGRVLVLRGRAEELGRIADHREAVEVVTARSFGAPGVTAECASPLVEVDGLVVVSEPPDVEANDRWPSAGLQAMGLVARPATRFDGRFGFRVLEKVETCPDRFPRRVGIPTKRPIF